MTGAIHGLLLVALVAGCSAHRGPEGSEPTWGKVDLGLTPQERALGEFLKGEVALRNGDSTNARIAFEKAAALDPEPPRIHARLAHLLVRRGELEKALPHARAAVAGNPDDSFSRTMLAGTLEGMGATEEASAHYQEIIQRAPELAEPYLLLAALYRKTGNEADAQKTLEKLIQADPDSVMGHYYLGRLHASAGRLQKSEDHFREALRKNPRSTLVLVDLGLIEEMRQRPESAANIYRRVLVLDPENEIARERLAGLLIGQKKFTEALAHFRALERIEDDPTETRVKIALVYLDQGDYDRAATELELVLRATPGKPDVHYYLGITYSEIGELEAARENMLAVAPGAAVFADAQLQLAYLAQQEGDIAQAALYAEAAVAARPDAPGLMSFRIAIERDRGNLPVAISLATKLSEDHPENDRYQFTLGALLDESGNRAAAITTMRRAIALNPRNSEALNYLGYTFAEQGVHLEEAESLILRALAVEPEDGFYLDSLGWVYFQQGRYARAVEKLERAVELTGNDPTIQEHLGDAYRRMGREAEARRIYETAGDSAPSEIQRQRLQKKLLINGNAGRLNEQNL